MELQNEKQRIVTIVTFLTLITIFNPADSECVPRSSSYLAKSLAPVFPSSNPPSSAPSPSPSPSPELPSEKASPSSSPNPAVQREPPAPSSTYSAPKGSPAPLSEPPTPSFSPVPSNAPIGKESPQIKDICSKTDFPPLCESAVIPLLTGTKPDTVSVLQFTIQAAAKQTEEAIAAMGKQKDTPDSGTSLLDCNDLYDDALSNLQQAADAAKSGDMDTVNSMLSAALTDYSTCADGFEETGVANPVADLGDKLMKMASNCLAVASLIK